MWTYLITACCCGAGIFEPTAHNPWDELRQVFYSRQFSNGEVYDHDAALDGPPFTTWSRFYHDEKFYRRVVAKLDKFLEQSADELERQPPLRRAILLRDLWPAFDAQTNTSLAKSDVATQRQGALRKRLADIMRRLELSEQEAQQLPDNLTAAVEGDAFPAVFDEQSPEKGFLPRDLFDETGPWVAIGQGKKVPGASAHFGGRVRSIIVPYVRVSADRQDSINYLIEYRNSPKAPPPGTLLALVRRMVLPTSSGRMMATPIVESLQLAVVAPPRDHRYKFVLDRAELIAGKPGLRMLSDNDPVDAYGFEASGLGLKNQYDFDADGEALVLGHVAGRPSQTSLGHCVACHGQTTGARLFANGNGADFLVAPTTWDAQAKLILSLRQQDESWKVYRSVRE